MTSYIKEYMNAKEKKALELVPLKEAIE